MTGPTDRFHRLSELFEEIVELPDAARDEAIRERCDGDATLERELRSLLAADAAAGVDDFFAGVVSSEADALQRPEFTGVRLGSWRIVEPIGEGGMGTVYLAERSDGAYEAKAALKLVRGGIPSPTLADRFRAERQILAGLSHPGVAQLLDGGSTDDGTPYLVMEFIDGEPINKWCDEHDLDVEQCLRLFLKVCDAVAYAHRELVAHRDLKPSNLLVTAAGEPKLLDFGIAKLVDTMGEATEGVTQNYTLLTPAYASPEQVAGDRASTSADLYSLGVLLYELLSGRLPIETKGLAPAQLISKVTGDVPVVVSAAVDDRDRQRRLSGDLDAIVSRALRKEPEARYASVEAFANDIRLHLEGRPIRARHDDWRYRTGKAVRRNAGAVTASALMLILGISFTVNTVVQSRALARERDRAEAERASAERVSGFLEELFTEADPNATSDRDITVREILDRGATRVLTTFEEDVESRAALATVIGRAYTALGELEAAEPLIDSALAMRSRTPGDPEALAEALVERGALAYNSGDYAQTAERAAQAITEFERAGVGDTDAHADALSWLAVAQMDLGNLEEAERIMREAVAMHRRVDAGPNEYLATALVSLEDILRDTGKLDEAVSIGEEGLEMSRQVYGSDHLAVASALNQLASSLRDSGRPAEAIPLVEEGLEIRRNAFDGPHVEIAASLGNLANMLAAVGRNAESIAPRRASVEMLGELFSGNHPYVAGSTASLGTALLRADSLDAAEGFLVDGLAASRLAFPEGHPQLANPLNALATLNRRLGRYDEALRYGREAYAIRVAAFPERHWNIAASALEIGRTLDALQDDDEAEQRLEEAHGILLESFGADDSRTEQARSALHAHLVRRGLTDRAAALGGGN